MKKNNKKSNTNGNKKNSLLIVALVLVVALIAGGTYAYWTWNSNNLLTANVTIDTGTMTFTLNGGGTTSVGNLAPADCTATGYDTTYVAKFPVTVTRSNTTDFPGTIDVSLQLTSLTWKNAKPTGTQLANVKYILTSSSSLCKTAVGSVSGSLSGATIGSTANTAQTQTTNISTWTYTIPANTASGSQNYYLYFWIDPGYTFTNWGSGLVQDPLEDLKFTVTWTSNGIITQSGS